MIRYPEVMQKSLTIATVLFASLWISLPAQAQSFGDLAEPGNSLLQPVRSIQCLFVDKRSGLETMINRCGQCRMAKVSRKRPGAMAIYRTVHVPAGQRVQLPFRGRGQTRITEETFCANAKGEDPNQLLEDRAKCLQLRNMRTAGMVMVNLCDKCRSAVIERIGDNNQNTRQLTVVKGRAYIPLPAQGANSARIISERKCRPGDAR